MSISATKLLSLRGLVVTHADHGGPRTILSGIDLDIHEGEVVTLGNGRGQVRLHVSLFDGLRRGVLIAEGIWPNKAHLDGQGINVLTGADSPAPFGGAAFHDNKVWVKA